MPIVARLVPCVLVRNCKRTTTYNYIGVVEKDVAEGFIGEMQYKTWFNALKNVHENIDAHLMTRISSKCAHRGTNKA